MNNISRCRICKNDKLTPIMDLGEHALSCRFPFNYEPDPLACPLILLKCDDANNGKCGLVQLQTNVPSDELYMHNYGYRSGLNKTMIDHLTALSGECKSRVSFKDDDFIIDIGSNDATLLKSYSIEQKINKVGIDPTGTQFRKFYTDDITLIPDFFSATAFNNVFPGQKAKIVTSISMFYDLPDPVQFMNDIKNVLHPEGIWVTEQSYIVTMLERKSFDTVCHEHLEYYAFKQVEYMANIVGLKILDVTLNDCNGGSFRTVLTHIDNSSLAVNTENINKLKIHEAKFELDTMKSYDIFNTECEIVRQYLCKFLSDIKRSGKTIYLYGASTKGNTLLQYFNIDNTIITAAAERNTEKYGRRTPKTDIPIVSELEMRKANPDFLLVLPWHFREEFISRETDYLNGGGQLIFPLPNFEIYTNKKIAFITGINGQIGHYLTEILLDQDYIVYGLLHNNTENLHPRVNYVYGDLKDVDLIKQLIIAINPDEIYNLGGETDTVGSINEPVKCFDVNARIIFTICETIKNLPKKIKFFQANSAELYKGLLNGEQLVVNEEMLNFHPLTPYGISKLSSYWAIRYYREKFNLFGCNGMIFTTESPYRLSRYLSKKIANFVKSLDDQPNKILSLGNLNCCRDWIHANDVASGIFLMMQQDEASDYIISSKTSNTIRTMIDLFFKTKNIDIVWVGEGPHEKGIDSKTGQVYIEINPEFIRPFENNEDLVGDNSKLKNLGWSPQYSLEDIIIEMMEK